MSIPTLERSKRRASSLITLKNLFQKFPKKLSSLLISLRNRNAYISFHFSCFLGLTPSSLRFFPIPFPNPRREKIRKKERGERERERENRRSRNTYRDLRRRNFSASLPIIVSSIDRTPQFLPTGSRPAAKSVCGRENIDVYRDADVGAPENLISPKDASNGALATSDHCSFLPSFLRFFVTPWDDREGGGNTTENLNWNDECYGKGGFCPFLFESRFPAGEPFTLMAKRKWKNWNCAFVGFFFFLISSSRWKITRIYNNLQ